MEFLTESQLNEKWAPVLDHESMDPIKDPYRRKVTAVLLENQQRALNEEKMALNEAVPNSSTANVTNYDPVLIGLVRRAAPKLIAYDICGVQPMTMPTGLVFALRSRYTNAAGAEALFNEADITASAGGATPGTGTAGSSPVETTAGLSPWDGSPGFTAGPQGVTTAQSEDFGGATTLNQMSFTIEKQTATVKARALKAEYTVELVQDLKAVHGLNAEDELSNILSSEIIAEINREVIRTMYKVAVPGAQINTATPGTFDLDVDANGRWSVERFKGMLFQIERDANRIAQTTRRGRGNFILCSADVASALTMAGMLDYAPALSTELTVDETGATFVGVLNKKYKVYVDPYMGNGTVDQFALVGYRGSSPFDAGIFYCPYVPLQLMRAVDPSTFQPKIGFKTRYALVGHPLNGDPTNSTNSFGLSAQTNYYYRMFKVTNLS